MRTDSNRTVVHLDLDSFFVSVERLKNSSLVGKPVIIGGTSDRGVVASCSYEARRYGVTSAMPMKLARTLCPEAVYIKGDWESYSQHSNTVTQIIEEEAPLYEKASIDEHYLDITGMDKYFGCYKWSSELRQKIIKNTGLPISFGLSVNKTVSKIATGESKPNGQLQVPQPDVKGFLSPLSVRKIPMIGKKTYELLRSMGVSTIRTISMMPQEMMVRVLGDNGKTIWEKANGIDPTPVQPYSERKSISSETTFDQDTTDVEMLNRVLVSMVEDLAYKLRNEQKLTSCVTIKIRYSNFDTHTQQKRIGYTAMDHNLIEVTQDLFKKLYQRRMLIRLIGIRFTHLVHGVQQIDLFEDTSEMISLYQAIDKVRRRFGEKAVVRALNS